MEQKANFIRKFLVSKWVLVLNHFPYSPDWHHVTIFCSRN